MRANDIALMGFMSAASDYIKNNADKADMIDLSNEELDKIKDSFDSLESLSDNRLLMEEGAKAFDKYINNKINSTKNIFSELGEIFDIDFDDDVKEENKNVIENEEEASEKISQLLSSYDTDEDIADFEEDNDPELTEKLFVVNGEEDVSDAPNIETKIEKTIQENETPQEKQDDEPKINIQVIEDESQFENFGISDDDEMLNQIANAVAKTDEELKTFNNPAETNNADAQKIIEEVETSHSKLSEDLHIFKQEYDKESNIEEPNEVKIDINDVLINKDEDENASLSQRLRNIGNNSHYHDYILNPLYNVSNEEEIRQTETVEPDHLLSGFKNAYKDEEVAELETDDNQTEVIDTDSNYPSFAVIENPGVDIDTTELNKEDDVFKKVEEDVTVDEATKEEVDNKLAEAIDALNDEKQETEEVEAKEVSEDEYIDSLISDLKEKIVNEKKDENANAEDSKNDIYNRISKIYTNLSDGFIRTVYDLKEPLAKQYALGEPLIVLHRCNFDNIDRLREFVEVMMSHNYSVNVDEAKMIVDTFREFVNTDGKILTNIFEVANQAKVLSGNYEGYRVIKREE